MPLDLPQGSRCFIDANIFYYRFVRTPGLTQECRGLLNRVESGEIAGHSAVHVLGEAVHKVMLAEAAVRFARPRTGLVGWLGRHPQRIGELEDFRRAAKRMSRLPINLLSVDVALLVDAADVSIETGLLTNDATSVALMRRDGLGDLAGNDGDFAGVAGVTLRRPSGIGQVSQQ